MRTSYLQKLWRKTGWLIYFKLHPIPLFNIKRELELTPHAIKAVTNYNIAVDTLKRELRRSYEANKHGYNLNPKDKDKE